MSNLAATYLDKPGRIRDMDITTIRFKINVNGARSLCVTCGLDQPVPGDWLTLADLQAGAAHGCRQPGRLPPEHGATARFVAERMEMAQGAYVSMEAVRDAWYDWPGSSSSSGDPSIIARRIRAALPFGVTVQRCRIDGVRQNWIMGMRLR